MLTTIFIVFALFFILERLAPGWSLLHVKSWPWRVLLVNGIQLCVVLLAALTWERWLSSIALFHLSEQVSPMIGGFFAYFVATFIFYWWHSIVLASTRQSPNLCGAMKDLGKRMLPGLCSVVQSYPARRAG